MRLSSRVVDALSLFRTTPHRLGDDAFEVIRSYARARHLRPSDLAGLRICSARVTLSGPPGSCGE
ncbi:hypothetical protein ACQF36_03560 [Streptomyces sp. Marseille-Q5077]|uniref:hypothetical protein n=1 Tax=Streptomyces sp. Marseille-Q5077 TaxID=3418995 RepID=UPI003CFE2075